MELCSDEDLLTDKWKGVKLTKDEINSMNQIIRLTKQNYYTKHFFGGRYLLYKSRFTHD